MNCIPDSSSQSHVNTAPPFRGRRTWLPTFGTVLATVSLAVSATAAETAIRFDEDYTVDKSLIEQRGFGWELWTPQNASPVVRADRDGRVGAFSSGAESRAVLTIDEFATTGGPIRLEFAASIPNVRSHSSSFVQVGLGDSTRRFETSPLITVSVNGLMCANGIAIEDPSVQKAWLDGDHFKPTPNETIHVRCDFDFEANTATIAVSEDGGSTYEELSASEDGGPFTIEPLASYDRIYLRMGDSPEVGVYSIALSQ